MVEGRPQAPTLPPPSTVQYCCKQAGAQAVLTTPNLMGKCTDWFGVPVVTLDNALYRRPGHAPLNALVKPHNGFYAVFTSGSTGTPKGCYITHQNFNNELTYLNAVGVLPSVVRRSLLYHMLSFDFSHWEVCVCSFVRSSGMPSTSDAERQQD